MVQVEDEDRFPSGQYLLADDPDPRRPAVPAFLRLPGLRIQTVDLAAAEIGPLGPDRAHARLEGLPGPAVPLHPPPAIRAGRRRKLAAERLQKRRVERRSAAQKAVADRRLDRVQIQNPAGPQLRLQPGKRTTELGFSRPHERMQRARPGGRVDRRLDLATTNPAALAPISRRNAVLLKNHGRLLRRLLVRQTPQKRHRLRMAELQILCIDCHDHLCCPSPGGAAPAVRGSSETDPGSSHAAPRTPPLQTSGRRNRAPRESAKQMSPKNMDHTLVIASKYNYDNFRQ